MRICACCTTAYTASPTCPTCGEGSSAPAPVVEAAPEAATVEPAVDAEPKRPRRRPGSDLPS